MVDELIHSRVLEKRSIADVLDLLGNPIRTYEGNGITTLVYYIGFSAKIFAIDPSLLIIQIRNHRVAKYFIKV